ncbi:hypothetical protein NDU88_007804 [Pleurodeles waltl]|uniref:Uncharacterized protein n=1 Tax=Pleurodeles waltl TaxID=8319 RepID=A0AAV7RVU6_PLEWA|nr:hypothetical protein NDU88_007804 [Pleurodeles waltl]
MKLEELHKEDAPRRPVRRIGYTVLLTLLGFITRAIIDINHKEFMKTNRKSERVFLRDEGYCFCRFLLH